MAGKEGTTRSATEERIEKVEEWLCAGIAPGRVERQLAEQYGITLRQARRIKDKVYARWGDQSQGDAPHRREKSIRMMERLYATALKDGELSVAQRCAAQLLKASGAFTQRSATRSAALERLGPPPVDSAKALPYAQQVLLIELHEVITNVHLDPRERLRWESEITAKLGMTYSRSEVLEAVGRIEGLLADHRALPGAAKVVDAKTIARPPTARGQGGRRGPRALPPPDPDDGDDEPSGGAGH